MLPRKNQNAQHLAQLADDNDHIAPGIADDALAADDSGLGGLEQFLTANAKRNTEGSDSDGTDSLPAKVAAPADTDQEREAIQALQSAYSRMIAVPPKKSRKSCVGYFHSDPRLVAIPDKPIDTISRTSGYSSNAVIYLMPEEWLLFVERGSLLIADKGIDLEKPSVASYGSIWSAALNTARLNLDIYRAYAYLRRLGYIVVCSDTDRVGHSTNKESSSESSTSTATRTPVSKAAPISLSTSWVTRLIQRISLRGPKYTYNDIFGGLLGQAPRNASAVTPTNRPLSDRGYSVYRPEVPYKKRAPGQPHYRMVVESAQAQIPPPDQLLHLAHSDCSISTVICVSEPAVTGFMRIQSTEIPDAPSRTQDT